MYLIQYSEAAERLGWNVKDCTDDNNSIIISRNGVTGRVYNFKLNKENFIADMERLASQFNADAYAMEYYSTHKSWSKQFWTIPLPLRFVRTGIPKSNSTVIRTKAPKWLSITSRRYYKTMGTKTHPSILMQCLSCNSI